MLVELYDSDNLEWFDLSPYVALNGWKDSINDVDGPNAGRNILGDMIRDRVATKFRADVTLTPIKASTLKTIRRILRPTEFNIRIKEEDSDPWEYRHVYSNNYSWSHLQHKANGEDIYDKFTFPLIDI